MANLKSYTTQWAENAIRPLVKLIDFENLNPIVDNFRSFKDLNEYIPVIGEIKCRIVFILQENEQIENLGYSYSLYADGCYSLAILLNKKLFEGDQELNTPLWRKLIGKHELLHCLSALFCIPDLNDDESRRKFQKEYNAKLTLDILSVKKIEEVKQKHDGRTMDNYPHPTIFSGDDHYRLSRDDSPLKYHNLYDWLLLPKDKFELYFNESEVKRLKRLSKVDLAEAYRLSTEKTDAIVERTHLEERFVLRRIKEILLSYAI